MLRYKPDINLPFRVVLSLLRAFKVGVCRRRDSAVEIRFETGQHQFHTSGTPADLP